MAVISCPKCQGKLRFPDDSPPRRVKCASCAHSFMAGPNGPVSESARKSQEVDELFDLDDDRPAPARRRNNDEDERPRSKRRDRDDDEERPRSKSARRRDVDDEEDQPKSNRGSNASNDFDFVDDDDSPVRSRRRDRDDDDDYQPRSRRRGRYDDEDDDDRPRSRRRSRDDDDYDDKRSEKEQFQYAKRGVSLIAIGFWCQLGAIAIFVFIGILSAARVRSATGLMFLAGLPGLANWIVSIVGFSFLIAGPRKGNLFGLSIATTAVAGVQLLFLLYVGFAGDALGKLAVVEFGRTTRWEAFLTSAFYIPAVLIFSVVSSFESMLLLPLLCGLLDIARFILLMLIFKEIGRLMKREPVRAKAQYLLVAMPSLIGITSVLLGVLVIVAKETGPRARGDNTGMGIILFVMALAIFVAFVVILCMSGSLCNAVKHSLSYRKTNRRRR